MLAKVGGMLGLLASVWFVSALSGTAAFAQDAVADETAVGDVAVVETPALEIVAVDPVLEAVALASPAPAAINPIYDGVYTDFSDDQLASDVTEISRQIAFFSADPSPFSEAIVLQLQDQLDALNAEVDRRAALQPPAPENPGTEFNARQAEQDVLVILGSTPPREFCAALVESGDFSDCPWAFRQTQ